MDEKSEAGQDNLIDDVGAVQNALANLLLPDTHYYVDAKKNEMLRSTLGSAVYSYEDTEEDTQLSNGPLHHKASSSDGNCLTYSSTTTIDYDDYYYYYYNNYYPTSSSLQSVGVDCESKLQPLCFREVGVSDLSFINEQCGNCDDLSVTPTCHKWETLEDSYEQGDAFKVTGVEICTDMCGPKVRQENEYCSVG